MIACNSLSLSCMGSVLLPVCQLIWEENSFIFRISQFSLSFGTTLIRWKYHGVWQIPTVVFFIGWNHYFFTIKIHIISVINLYQSNDIKLFFITVYIAWWFFRCIFTNKREERKHESSCIPNTLHSELISLWVMILALSPKPNCRFPFHGCVPSNL